LKRLKVRHVLYQSLVHSMPKSYHSVLDCLYQCIGDKKFKVVGWGNKTKAYGLKPSEFHEFENCTRRMFYQCRYSLLAQNFIKEIKTDKTKKSNHKPKYGITPLGIIKLFQSKPIGLQEFNDFMKMLADNYDYDDEFPSVYHTDMIDYEELDINYIAMWYELTNKKLSKDIYSSIVKMFEGIKPNILCKVLFEAIKYIEIDFDGKKTEVTLGINSKNSRIVLWKFEIKDDAISCLWSPYGDEFDQFGGDYVNEEWTFKNFYFHLTEFILEIMWYNLSVHYYKELPRYLLQGNTLQDRAQRTGPADGFIDMLNTLVFLMAPQMLSQK